LRRQHDLLERWNLPESRNLPKQRVGLVRALLFALASLILVAAHAEESAKVSSLGQYRGYSQTSYDGWVRASDYITARDGTRLAADIIRPARGGVAAGEQLPVIWTYDRYHRADLKDGRLSTQLDESPWLRTVIRHGYVIGVVDVRGGGASFGSRRGELFPQEAQDCYDVTEWFAAQPWCNKRVGMFGRSYMGMIQYLAASVAPPHLVAIFPEMALFDLYSFVYPGGVFRDDFVSEWSRRLTELDKVRPAAGVDADNGGALLAKALKEHQANQAVLETVAALPFRDSKEKATGSSPYVERSPATYLSRIKNSKVAIYHLSGWYDMWPRDALLWFKNLDNPRKLVIGPWAHTQSNGLDLAAEHLRWYDYWLKGIDNKVMSEPPIHYYTMGAPEPAAWRSASQWPLPDEKPVRFYFEQGPSKSDSLLGEESPTAASGKDDYRVDYSTTSGKATRWTNGYGGAFGYTDMADNDMKGLTYTTQPFSSGVEVTGHPLINLWISSSSKEIDLFAYLEEVDQNGNSQYVTEGVLRSSHRATFAPPVDYLGLPYHRGFASDASKLAGDEPVNLVFDLLPTSFIIDRGHRIRITLTGADANNASTPQQSPPPVVSVYRNVNHASYITVPIIASPGGAVDAASQSQGGGSGWLLISVALAALALVIASAAIIKGASIGRKPSS